MQKKGKKSMKNNMSDFEKEELFKRIHNMDAEEMELACMAIPSENLWNELHRRSVMQDNMLSAVREVVQV